MTAQADNGREALLERAIRSKRAGARSQAFELPRRPDDSPPTLGDMQRGLWLLSQLDPESVAYNMSGVLRFPGALDPLLLERALGTVVARHRILRSSYVASEGAVLQRIHPASTVALERLIVDDGDLAGSAIQQARRPFDLEAGPLLRLVLLETPRSAESLLLIVLHHIVADERSLAVVWRELAAAYEDPAADAVGFDAAPGPQFDDWVHLVSQRSPERREQELDAWRRDLEPLPEELQLPFEGTRANGAAPSGRLLRRSGGSAALAGALRLAARLSVSPFTLFAFTFRLLLQRYVPGRRFAFATPVSTRSHPATADMVGYFLNPVVVPTQVDEDLELGPAVERFGAQLRELLRRTSAPFDAVLEDLALPRQPDRHPLFQAMFVYQEAAPPVRMAGVALEPQPLDLGESKFDLSLFVTERAGSPSGATHLEIALEYRADRFETVWMERLLGHYETLLGRLEESLSSPVAGVEMLTAAEDAELTAFGSGEPLEAGRIGSMPARIRDSAIGSPEAEALLCGGVSWTYGDLRQAADRVAVELGGRQIGAGERVGLYLARSPELIAALVGTHWAGAAYLPLDPGYPASRNEAIVKDAEPAAILTSSSLLDAVPTKTAPSVAVDTLSGPASEAVFDLDFDLGRGLDDQGLDGAPDRPAYVLYTSGSTGGPKGVVVTQGNLRASTVARYRVYEAAPRRFLLVSSVAFDSSVAGLFWTLSTGGTLILPTDAEARDPAELARLIVDAGVDGLLCVPSLYAQILAVGGAALRSLRTAIVAGESCPPGLVQQHFETLPEASLYNEYGPTEATVWASVHKVDPAVTSRRVLIGRPIPGVRIDVLDVRGRRVPFGIPGEAVISGPTVARGYWGRDEETAARFGPVEPSRPEGDRFYRSGDRVSWDLDGRLSFLGREDTQIKLRGFRIEPGEVEAALLERPEIDAAAVMVRDASTGSGIRQLVAFVGTASQESPDIWRRDLELRLPDFMLPQRLVTMPELPRLPNGKVDRARLSSMPLESTDERDLERPASDLEAALVALWEGLLRRADVGVTDNFFELGGHSLLVLEMARSIARDRGVDLAAADIFQRPTIRQLAERIERYDSREATHYAHLFPIQPVGRRRPLVVAIPHVFSAMLAERFRGDRPVYGLRGVGLRPEGNLGRWPTMADLGAELVDEVERRFGGQSCIVAGYSFGASMAAEAVRQMEAKGLSVHRLYLLAPMPLNIHKIGPVHLQVRGLRQPLDELSVGEQARLVAADYSPLTRRPYVRAWRYLKVQPKRRFLSWLGKRRQRRGLPLTPEILHADVRIERFRLHREFRPRGIRTPTVIFNPHPARTDAAATWRLALDGPTTVIEVPDPHDGAVALEQAKQIVLAHIEELEGD